MVLGFSAVLAKGDASLNAEGPAGCWRWLALAAVAGEGGCSGLPSSPDAWFLVSVVLANGCVSMCVEGPAEVCAGCWRWLALAAVAGAVACSGLPSSGSTALAKGDASLGAEGPAGCWRWLALAAVAREGGCSGLPSSDAWFLGSTVLARGDVSMCAGGSSG